MRHPHIPVVPPVTAFAIKTDAIGGRPQILTFEAALRNFDAAVLLPMSDIARDAAILRFQLVFDLGWKAVQRIARAHGFITQSPRQALEAAYEIGWIRNEELWSDILKARLIISQTYDDDIAYALGRKLPLYYGAFKGLVRCLKHDAGLIDD